QIHESEAFASAGERETTAALDEALLFEFGDVAVKADMVLKAEFSGKGFEIGAQVAVAGDPELGGWDLTEHERPRGDHLAVALVVFGAAQAADHEDGCGRRAGLEGYATAQSKVHRLVGCGGELGIRLD